MTRSLKTRREPTAADVELIGDIRQRPAYHLACVWLERLLKHSSQPCTKGLRVGIESVAVLIRASIQRRAPDRPMTTAAFADPDLSLALLVALADLGFAVDERRDSFGHRHLACNVRDRAMFAFVDRGMSL